MGSPAQFALAAAGEKVKSATGFGFTTKAAAFTVVSPLSLPIRRV